MEDMELRSPTAGERTFPEEPLVAAQSLWHAAVAILVLLLLQEPVSSGWGSKPKGQKPWDIDSVMALACLEFKMLNENYTNNHPMCCSVV